MVARRGDGGGRAAASPRRRRQHGEGRAERERRPTSVSSRRRSDDVGLALRLQSSLVASAVRWRGRAVARPLSSRVGTNGDCSRRPRRPRPLPDPVASYVPQLRRLRAAPSSAYAALLDSSRVSRHHRLTLCFCRHPASENSGAGSRWGGGGSAEASQPRRASLHLPRARIWRCPCMCRCRAHAKARGGGCGESPGRKKLAWLPMGAVSTKTG